jgi:hypothetical protein
MNVVWGIRWDRGQARRRAASAPARALIVALHQIFPPARLNGSTLDLLCGVSGRQRAEVEPVGLEGDR